jgi:RES domain-containing protein
MHRSARAAGDYTGAMLAGGRWNPIGVSMLYTAQSLSLACIEVLVHLDKSQLPRDYVWSRTELPETPELLRFANLNDILSCQAAGHSWVSAVNELAVQVPSIVISEEFNILLNPSHSGYDELEWTEPRPFRFDPRLFIAEPHNL